MRILIVYASRYGQTEKVVRRIADVLRSRGVETHSMHVRDARDLAARAFDMVVLAGSVYFGKHQRELVAFATQHRDTLAKVRSVLISVSGAARSEASMSIARENAEAFVKLTGWTPSHIELVAGGEPYTRYGFFTKWFMKRFAKKQGRVIDPNRDYDFTDWNAVDRFADELAGRSAPVDTIATACTT